MDLDQARYRVIAVGLALQKEGLIARTWGNVSCRVDEGQFVVTPSGRAYQSLHAEDIVLCQVADASHQGKLLPSLECGLHALLYRRYPQLNFVIHTHQTLASAASVVGLKVRDVPLAAYAPAGSEALCQAVAQVLGDETRAVLLSHHGLLCFGEDHEQAFAMARHVEWLAEAALMDDIATHCVLYGEGYGGLYRWYLGEFGLTDWRNQPLLPLYASERIYDGYRLEEPEGPVEYHFANLKISAAARFHRELYLRNDTIHVIRQVATPAVLTVSQAPTPLLPYLDDFAQIIGPDMPRLLQQEARAVSFALQGRQAVLLPSNGAILTAANAEDAAAAALIAEKNALCQIIARMRGDVEPLAPQLAAEMRKIYFEQYARRIYGNL